MEMRRQAGMIDNLVFKNAAEKEAALSALVCLAMYRDIFPLIWSPLLFSSVCDCEQ